MPAQVGTSSPAEVTASATATAGRSMLRINAAPLTARPARSPSAIIQAGRPRTTRDIGGSAVAASTVTRSANADHADAMTPATPVARLGCGPAHGSARLAMRGIVQPSQWPDTRVVRNRGRANPLGGSETGA
jgi:hypothetical protein